MTEGKTLRNLRLTKKYTRALPRRCQGPGWPFSTLTAAVAGAERRRPSLTAATPQQADIRRAGPGSGPPPGALPGSAAAAAPGDREGEAGAAARLTRCMEPPGEGSEMAAALRAAKRALRGELRQRLRALDAAEKQRQSRLLSRKVGAGRGPAPPRLLPGRAARGREEGPGAGPKRGPARGSPPGTFQAALRTEAVTHGTRRLLGLCPGRPGPERPVLGGAWGRVEAGGLCLSASSLPVTARERGW